jgi:hypothetical protein
MNLTRSILNAQVSSLIDLRDSLQREFEYMVSFSDFKVLKAKKNQIDQIEEAIKLGIAASDPVRTSDKPMLKWVYIDGKLTHNCKLRSMMPSVFD